MEYKINIIYLHLQDIKEVSSVFSRWRKVRENDIKKKNAENQRVS